MNTFETITLIANPAAQNGRGRQVAELIRTRLQALVGPERLRYCLTQHACHATVLAEQMGQTSDLVIALGGDGLVHEVVNGLMRIEPSRRPTFGLVPVGSGNDYANSLGLSFKPEEALTQLMVGNVQQVDIGLCNGEYYAETLSFGLDAAIALDTMERRKVTGHTGMRLYFEAGVNQLLHHLDNYDYTLEYVDARGESHQAQGQSYIFAVQVGPTYGGGFRICPQARLDDGLLDICICHPPMSVAKALMVFAKAKDGKHTKAKQMEFFQAKSLKVSFAKQPPTQIDGEAFPAHSFEVSLLPRALRVLRA